MTYEECLELYGSQYDNYCSQFESAGSDNPIVWFFDSIFGWIGDLIGGLFADFLSGVGTLILIVLAIMVVVMSVKVVRHTEVAIVERAGRYRRSLDAGPHLIIPIVDRVVARVDLEIFQLGVPTIVKTNEDQFVTIPVQILYRVIPEKAAASHYKVDDPEKAIKALVSNEIKAKAAGMTLQEIFDDRRGITETVKEQLSETIEGYGFLVENVVIDNPELSAAMQEAFNDVTIAKKEQVAATARGEALKIEKVAAAEAEAAALTINGQAFIKYRNDLAEGHADAVEKMAGQTGVSPSEVLQFLARVDNNDAVRDAANSGATVVVATADSNQATLGLVAAGNSQ